jgi:Mg2+ and Co2+ transporter CorA
MPSSKAKGTNNLPNHSFSDALQMFKMEEHVKELETQLKEAYKGQIGNNQEVIKYVRENKDLADKVRDLEKKTTLYQDRLKEYEEIMTKL